VTIAAPLEEVWAYGMDLTKIPEYNPRVARVDLDGGHNQRAAGVSYQCHLVGGRHHCTEEDVEIVPMARIVTRLRFDTFGITALLRDYTVETSLRALDGRTTKVAMSHSYATPTLRSRLLDWIVRDTIARNTQATLRTLKARIERAAPSVVTRETMGLLQRPAFVTAIAIFFFVVAAFSLVVGGALLAPRSALAVVWSLKPQAQFDFLRLGGLGVAFMLALALAAVLAALGLWVGTKWGWRLAATLLAVNLVADAARGLTVEPRAAIGVPIVAAILLFLARSTVRRWCALA
jgi:uncharacterized protein YndB with AHSA1/START domain